VGGFGSWELGAEDYDFGKTIHNTIAMRRGPLSGSRVCALYGNSLRTPTPYPYPVATLSWHRLRSYSASDYLYLWPVPVWPVLLGIWLDVSEYTSTTFISSMVLYDLCDLLIILGFIFIERFNFCKIQKCTK